MPIQPPPQRSLPSRSPRPPEARRRGGPWPDPRQALTALALLSAPLGARAEPAGPPEGTALHAHAPAARHHVMAMIAPGVAERGGAFTSVGAGYEHRLPGLGGALGVGGMAEVMMMTGHAHQMLMASLTLHPAGGLLLQVSAGAVHRHAQSARGSTSSGERMSTSGVVRLTAGWDLHAGAVMLTPHVNADLGDRSTRAISAGLCAGTMF